VPADFAQLLGALREDAAEAEVKALTARRRAR